MITNRRNFMIGAVLAGAGLTLPSLSFSEDNNSNSRIKGFAIQDPFDKQKIKGFISIPTIWGEQLRPEAHKISDYSINSKDKIIDPLDISSKRINIGLVEAINKYTDIEANSDRNLYLSSTNLVKYPFIYVATDKAFELSTTEKQNFNNYLRNGGFALLESLEPEYDLSQGEASLKQMIKDTLKEDARFLPIPNSHSIYHCFFDFNDGPPQGTETGGVYSSTIGFGGGVNASTVGLAGWQAKSITFTKPRPYLEGIFLDDRIAVVYSGKGYGKKWVDITNNDPQQKMVVNFVVYALTQKGRLADNMR
jgi:hypothetical protein